MASNQKYQQGEWKKEIPRVNRFTIAAWLGFEPFPF